MKKLTDEELINEVKQRFIQTKNSLAETKRLMKRLEEVNKKLEESEALKSNFLSNIRNEINNPLSSIIGLSQAIVTAGLNDPKAVTKFATTIYREAFNLDFQLKNIFVSAELESGEVYIASELADMIKVMAGIIDTYQHLLDEKQIVVKCTPDLNNVESEKILFRCDSEKLHLILTNLLDNAIEFSAAGSEITINFEKIDGLLTFTIQNFGTLINIPNKNIIFDRFKQLDTGSKKSHKGHGLGLSLSRDLVEMMGGTIEVNSSESEGNVFCITLPDIETENSDADYSERGNDIFFGTAEEF